MSRGERGCMHVVRYAIFVGGMGAFYSFILRPDFGGQEWLIWLGGGALGYIARCDYGSDDEPDRDDLDRVAAVELRDGGWIVSPPPLTLTPPPSPRTPPPEPRAPR